MFESRQAEQTLQRAGRDMKNKTPLRKILARVFTPPQQRKARFVKNLPAFVDGQTRKLWRVSPSITIKGVGSANYVVTSAIPASQLGWREPETYIFPTTKRGTFLSLSELRGSIAGEMDHNKALRLGGFHG